MLQSPKYTPASFKSKQCESHCITLLKCLAMFKPNRTLDAPPPPPFPPLSPPTNHPSHDLQSQFVAIAATVKPSGFFCINSTKLNGQTLKANCYSCKVLLQTGGLIPRIAPSSWPLRDRYAHGPALCSFV